MVFTRCFQPLSSIQLCNILKLAWLKTGLAKNRLGLKLAWLVVSSIGLPTINYLKWGGLLTSACLSYGNCCSSSEEQLWFHKVPSVCYSPFCVSFLYVMKIKSIFWLEVSLLGLSVCVLWDVGNLDYCIVLIIVNSRLVTEFGPPLLISAMYRITTAAEVIICTPHVD